jgi:hypothetical protein
MPDGPNGSASKRLRLPQLSSSRVQAGAQEVPRDGASNQKQAGVEPNRLTSPICVLMATPSVMACLTERLDRAPYSRGDAELECQGAVE